MLSLTDEEAGKSGGITLGSVNTKPVKELTDDEIGEVEKLCKKPLASWAWQVEFARAILRKAQGD